MVNTLLKQIVILSVVSAVLFSVGCDNRRTKPVSEISETPSDREKTQLMKTIDRKFENPRAHYDLGQLYQNDGLWAQALYEYNIALSFDPAHRPAQAAKISVMKAMGDTSTAETVAESYITQTSGSASESLRLALAFQKENLDDLALRSYQQALRLAPNSAKVNRQIGYYYLSKGDNVRAKEYLYRSFQLNRNQPQVAGELGRLGVDVSTGRMQSGKELDKIVTESDKQRTQQ